MQLVGGEFTQCVLGHQSVSLPARGVVRACIDSSMSRSHEQYPHGHTAHITHCHTHTHDTHTAEIANIVAGERERKVK